MSLVQNNNPSLPTQYCATSIRTVGTNGASVAIRGGQPIDRWGNTAQTTPCIHRKNTNTLPSVCTKVMIMSYERHRWSTHSTEVRRYGQHRSNKMWSRVNRYLSTVLLYWNITGKLKEGDYLIRPQLITLIGHSASQEPNQPIAVNLLSQSLLLPL